MQGTLCCWCDLTLALEAPDTRAGGGAPGEGSQLSTPPNLWVRGWILTAGSQPAKLPSFGGYSLET